MNVTVRTFRIRGGEAAGEDEKAVSAFLRAVKVERIETSCAEDGWRLLVLYSDLRDKEEAAQIASLIVAELKRWRADKAAGLGIDPGELLSDDAVQRAAQSVPTTPLELRATLGTADEPANPYESEIVQVIRKTLDELA